MREAASHLAPRAQPWKPQSPGATSQFQRTLGVQPLTSNSASLSFASTCTMEMKWTKMTIFYSSCPKAATDIYLGSRNWDASYLFARFLGRKITALLLLKLRLLDQCRGLKRSKRDACKVMKENP